MSMGLSPPVVEVVGDEATIEAGYLAAKLGLFVDRLRAEMRRGIVFGVVERGIGEDAGRLRLTFRHRARSWTLVVEPDGTLHDVVRLWQWPLNDCRWPPRLPVPPLASSRAITCSTVPQNVPVLSEYRMHQRLYVTAEHRSIRSMASASTPPTTRLRLGLIGWLDATREVVNTDLAVLQQEPPPVLGAPLLDHQPQAIGSYRVPSSLAAKLLGLWLR